MRHTWFLGLAAATVCLVGLDGTGASAASPVKVCQSTLTINPWDWGQIKQVVCNGVTAASWGTVGSDGIRLHVQCVSGCGSGIYRANGEGTNLQGTPTCQVYTLTGSGADEQTKCSSTTNRHRVILWRNL